MRYDVFDIDLILYSFCSKATRYDTLLFPSIFVLSVYGPNFLDEVIIPAPLLLGTKVAS